MTFYKECPKRHVELIKIGYVNVLVIFQYPCFKRWMFRFKRVLHLEYGPHKTVRRTRQLRSWGARHAKKMKNMPRAINESLWASTSVSKVIKRLQWNYHVVQTTCANSIKWQCRRVLYGGLKLHLNSLRRYMARNAIFCSTCITFDTLFAMRHHCKHTICANVRTHTTNITSFFNKIPNIQKHETLGRQEEC